MFYNNESQGYVLRIIRRFTKIIRYVAITAIMFSLHVNLC